MSIKVWFLVYLLRHFYHVIHFSYSSTHIRKTIKLKKEYIILSIAMILPNGTSYIVHYRLGSIPDALKTGS